MYRSASQRDDASHSTSAFEGPVVRALCICYSYCVDNGSGTRSRAATTALPVGSQSMRIRSGALIRSMQMAAGYTDTEIPQSHIHRNNPPLRHQALFPTRLPRGGIYRWWRPMYGAEGGPDAGSCVCQSLCASSAGNSPMGMGGNIAPPWLDAYPSNGPRLAPRAPTNRGRM